MRDAAAALNLTTFYGSIRFDNRGRNVAKDLEGRLHRGLGFHTDDSKGRGQRRRLWSGHWFKQ